MEIGSVVKFYLADSVRLVKGRASKQRVLCVGSKSCPLRSGQISIFVEGGNHQLNQPPELTSIVALVYLKIHWQNHRYRSKNLFGF